MKRTLSAVLVVCVVFIAGVSTAAEWNLVKNVQRLEWVSPDYKGNKEIDNKLMNVLDLTEKTKKEREVYEEAKRIAAMPALSQSKYMDSFLYYMFVRSLSLSKDTAEPDYWLGLLKAHDKSHHLLAAQLIRLKRLPGNSPDIRREIQLVVDWIKAQKPTIKVRPPEYTGNMLLGYKPRFNFAEGEGPKLYTLSYYKQTVAPPAGFQEDETYVSLLSRIKEGREDVLAEMADIYQKMGNRKEASDILYQHAMLKAGAKEFEQAKVLLDSAVRLNKENAAAKKERDRIKLELTYQSLTPAEPSPVSETVPEQKASPAIPGHLMKIDKFLTPPDRVVTPAELDGLSKSELRVMRNEVFARHGRIFQSSDLQDYFTLKPWYSRNAAYGDHLLSEVDKENIRIIQEFEDKAQ